MKKDDYDDISELLSDLEEDMSAVVFTNVDEKIKEVYSKHVEEDVYQAYEPIYYARRYNSKGGFADEDNFESNIIPTKNGFEYVLTNEAKPIYDKKYRLDEIIENGIYNSSNNPGKRKVYENTQKEIDSTNVIENEIEKNLKMNGWEFK